MKSCLILLLRNVRKHNSMKFKVARLRVLTLPEILKMQYCCKFLFVGEKQTSRPSNWKNRIWLTFIRMRIQNFPREISEIDTHFMMFEMQVTCRILVNQYAFHFQKPCLHKMICFLNSWKESVRTIVQWDASMIGVLFLINSLLVIFTSFEIVSQ